MVDVHSIKTRSYNMSRIRSRDTHPERIVRSAVHRFGYRFRLHRSDLPGKPDIVLPKHNKIILVHGCFWHYHRCKVGGRTKPKSNRRYWNDKLQKNVDHDKKNKRKLRHLGWKVLVVWECWTKDVEKLEVKLKKFLEQD